MLAKVDAPSSQMRQLSKALESAGAKVAWKVEPLSALVTRLYYRRFVGIFLVNLNTFVLSLKLRSSVGRMGGNTVILVTQPLVAIALWRSAAPVAYWCLGAEAEWWYLSSPMEKLFSILNFRVEALAARVAAVAISQSTRIAGLLAKASKTRVLAIPYGVDTEAFAPARVKPDSPLTTILFAGLVREAKGIDILVDACVTLASEFNLRLQVAGPVYPAWRRFAENLRKRALAARLTLEMPGQVPWDRLGHMMADADVLVLPSRQDVNANVVLEAMASGIPVVSSGVGGLKEVIERHKCGFVFEPNNVDSLVRQLRFVLGDGKLRRELGQNGRRAALESYSWTAVATTLVSELS